MIRNIEGFSSGFGVCPSACLVVVAVEALPLFLVLQKSPGKT